MQKITQILLSLMATAGLLACTENEKGAIAETTTFEEAPKWAQEAIWYQIFVERFRNGDVNNDPNPATMAVALDSPLPESWKVTPWTHNWYQQEDWAKETGKDFYQTVQQRRYGGDLIGVLEKLDYLEDLGINAIYFNPLNDAPSLHKYDPRNYHHIDMTFGPDPAGDLAKMASENPADPATWTWTSADSLFLKIIKSCHQRGIRVILDYSWSHTGSEFWAWKDVLKNLSLSPFKHWYDIQSFDNPSTPENEFRYNGYSPWMPELKRVQVSGDQRFGHPYEGNLQEQVKEHIFAVCKRWMDPNNDGAFDDGLDGMRLDVADRVPLGFWRDFRKYVRSVNPDFYLVGENWWTSWPDTLMDPRPWVQGDIFDAVMHYQWYKPARGFFIKSEDSLSKHAFQDSMVSIFGSYRPATRQAMMNLSASHDAPRLSTSFYNNGKYKYWCKPQENPAYRTDRPDSATWSKVRLFLLHQYTFVGSPHIWNGDEMGMWGADDPDNRKPLLWPDYEFEVETASSLSNFEYQSKPKFDRDLHQYYKKLIKLRKSQPALIYGDFSFVETGNEAVLGYIRKIKGEELLVLLNTSERPQEGFELPPGNWNTLLFGHGKLGRLEKMTGQVWK